MSRIFKSLTNTKDYLTGWYREHKNDDDVVLRLSNNDAQYSGTVRFNNATQNPTFQGFDGNEWVDFNAVKGDKGDKGDDFNEIVKLENLGTNNKSNSGRLFPPQYSTLPDNTIPIRTLQGGLVDLNGGFLPTMIIKEESDSLILTSTPQPYIWDFSNIDIASIKSNKEQDCFKAYGTIKKFQVGQDEIINKGQLVSLILSNNKICIKTVKSTAENMTEFIDNIQIIGIALEDKLEGQSCRVCTDGITTVRVSRNSSTNYINDNEVKFGSIGLLNNKGMISKALIKPKGDCKRIGYFMENINLSSSDYHYCLFNVKL